MRAVGIFLSIFITISVVFSAFADNCGDVQGCESISTVCQSNSGLPQSGSSSDGGGDHCLFHCFHLTSLIPNLLSINFHIPEQVHLLMSEHLLPFNYSSSLFRPPII